jgi:hypothetical protein
MTKLRELEKRLKDEPDNLGLRVMLAGALLEAGRRADAVELYRSVAVAYRDAGRAQQAITVCRSLLELAPDDAACQALLASLTELPERLTPMPGQREPRVRLTPPTLRPPSEDDSDGVPRRSSYDLTPLPAPLPYHVADPSVATPLRREDLPPSLRAELGPVPEIEGIAAAARQISASLIAASRQAEEAAEAAAAVASLVGDHPSIDDALEPRALPDAEEDDEDEDDVGEATIDAEELAHVRFDATPDAIAHAIRGSATAELADEDLESMDDVAEASAVGAELIDDTAAADPLELSRLSERELDPPVGEPPPSEDEIGTRVGGPGADDQGDEDLTLPPRAFPAVPRTVEDEVTSPRDLPAGVSPRARLDSRARPTMPLREPAPAEPTPRPRLPLPDPQAVPRPVPGLRSTARDPDPHGRPTLSSRELAAGARPTIPLREPPERLQAALPAFAPDDSSRRLRPPSIAPPTQASGPLASVLFAPIPPRNRGAVLQRFQRRLAAVGTTVIRRGETGHGLVLVVRGRLDVHAERSDGARVSLDQIGPGDHVGEIGLIAHAPAASYVVAAVDSELLVLPAADFYDVTKACPALWAQLANVAERRSRDHARRLQA